MKALLSITPGGPETLALSDVPEPKPGRGDLLVRVLACAINYPDVLLLEDRYQVKPPRPFAPGTEIAGVVEAIGEGVDGWREGQRLIAMIGYGGLAERALVPAERAFPLPDGLDAAEGSALLMTYATAYHGLVDRGGLQAGETLLVLGAAGGVGLAAIEVGKALGATVIAAVSSEEKAEAVRDAGADRTFLYPHAPLDRESARGLTQALKDLAGPGGIQLVLDPVGGDYAEPAFRALAWEGRYLVVGFPAGIPRLPLNYVLFKSCDVRGVFWGEFAEREPARNRVNVDQLLRWWEEGRIRPRIARRWPLAQGGEAIEWLAGRGAIGKAVVEMDAPSPA